MISKGFRNPTIREMYMFRPANDQLEPERMMNYELSFKQRLLEDRLMFGVNLFYLKADNLISTAMLDGKPLNVNTGKTEHSGFEVEASYRFNNHLKVRSNYSYLHMSNPQTLAPESKLYVAADYQTGGFSIHSGLQLVDGLYLATGEDKKKESYVLWNLTAAYQFTRHLSLFAKGDNLLAQRYQTLQGFPMPKATLMGGVKLSF
jgi:iron complex outermembrane receptor protein